MREHYLNCVRYFSSGVSTPELPCLPSCIYISSSRQWLSISPSVTTLPKLTLDPPRQPLFVQSITGLKAVYEAKEVAIHIFGKKAEGELARPFQAAPGMFGGAYL